MSTPTIVKQTKNYLLIKVPLLKDSGLRSARKNGKMTAAEKRLWKVIQEGEREYREGKTIRASSADEALKKYNMPNGNGIRNRYA